MFKQHSPHKLFLVSVHWINTYIHVFQATQEMSLRFIQSEALTAVLTTACHYSLYKRNLRSPCARQWGKWDSEVTSPFLFTFSTTGRWAVGQLQAQAALTPPAHWILGWNLSGSFWKEKYFFHLPGIKPRFLSRQSLSLAIAPSATYSRSSTDRCCELN